MKRYITFAVVSPGIDYDSDAVRSWTDLYGTMLPTTAASPAVRADYLLQVAACADRRRRLLAAVAAGRALAGHEMAIASSETQGGVLLNAAEGRRRRKKPSSTGRRRSKSSTCWPGMTTPRWRTNHAGRSGEA